jgi:hypothetical protein
VLRNMVFYVYVYIKHLGLNYILVIFISLLGIWSCVWMGWNLAAVLSVGHPSANGLKPYSDGIPI